MKEKDEKISDEKVKIALIKKALGYKTTEVIEEYAGGEEGEVKLLKKKVTKKDVPPDVTALKMLLDSAPSVESMSDEELEEEKERLYKILDEKRKQEEKEKKIAEQKESGKTT